MRKYIYKLFLICALGSAFLEGIYSQTTPKDFTGLNIDSTIVFKTNSTTIEINETKSSQLNNIRSYRDELHPQIPTSYNIDKGKVVGEIPFSTATSPVGTLTIGVPIDLYSEPRGFTPQISLSYNSQAGNGPVGIGWNISGLSLISRGNKSFYYDGKVEGAIAKDKTSALFLDGMRLIKLSEANSKIVYQSEQGNIKIIGYLNANSELTYFDVFYPDGKHAIYGFAGKSIGEDLFYPITKMVDKTGNVINYYYDNLPNYYRIQEITYGLSQQASVKFNYTNTRDDYFSLFISGKELNYGYLLESITPKFLNTELKSYTLTYGESGNTSVLKSISCSTVSDSYNPIIFYYGDNTQKAEFKQDSTQLMHYYNFKDPATLRFSKGKFDYGTDDDGIITLPNKASYSHYSRDAGLINHSENKIVNQYGDDETIIVTTGLAGNWGDYNPEIKTESGFVDIFCMDVDEFPGEEIVKVNNTVSEDKDRIDFHVYTANLYSGIAEKYTRTFDFNTLLEDHSNNKSITPKFYYTGDFNGDGKMEVLAVSVSDVMGMNGTTSCSLFDLDGNKKLFEGKSPFEYNVQFVKYNDKGKVLIDGEEAYAKSEKLYAIDYDGDGKTDLCLINDAGIHVYTFEVNGSNYQLKLINSSTHLKNGDLVNKDVLLGDFNGDGKTDFLISPVKASGSRDWEIYSSKGDGTFEFTALIITGKRPESRFITQDMNGDGHTDLVEVYDYNTQSHLSVYFIADNKYKDSQQIGFPEQTVLIPTNIQSRNYYSQLVALKNDKAFKISYHINQSKNRLLTGIVNSFGTVTKIGYQQLNEDRYGLLYEKGYGAKFPYYNYNGGYTVVSNTESYTNNIKIADTYYEYKNAVIHKQGLGFRGFEQITENDFLRNRSAVQTFDPISFGIIKSIDSPTSLVSNDYSIEVASNKVVQLLLTDKKVKDKLNDITTSSSYEYDLYGNLIVENISYGEGITTRRSNKLKNIDNGTVYLLGLPEEQILVNTRDGASISRKTSIIYNSNYLPTSKISYYNNNQVSEESFVYDTALNLKESKSKSYSSSNWLTDKYDYDSYGRVIRKTDPLNLYIDYGYDNKGLLETTKSHKGHETKYTYDTWGRNTSVSYPDGTVESTNLKWTDSPAGAVIVSTTTSTGQPDIQTYFDSQGREIRKGQKRFDGVYLYTDNVYDNLGRLEKSSQPFRGTNPTYWNTYEYDSYDRIKVLNYASGKKDIYTYAKLQTRSDIDGVASIKTYDASGEVISIEDAAGTIIYKYRPDGQPAFIIAPGNIKTSLEYDNYGRQTQINDPSAGTKVFTYDAAGNIEKETDDRGKITKMVYDSYNRLIKKEVVGELTTTYTFNGDGLLESEFSNNGTSVAYVYDELFRLKTQKETVPDDKWLQKTYAYNGGNLSSVSYNSSQSGDITSQNYIYVNGHNTEIKLHDGTSIWKLTGENNLGMSVSATTGVLSRTYGYDSFGLPTSRVIKNGTTIIQDFSYNFDSQTGNLNWRKDNTRNLREGFSYDRLNRLAVFGDKKMGYDEKGNITYFPNIGQFKYNSPKPYAITTIATCQEGDLDGLQNYRRGQTVTYTNMMRPLSISENNRITTFSYNGNGDRVKMLTQRGDTTELERYYIGGEYEIDKTVAGTEERLYLGGDAYSAAAVYVKQGTGAWQVQYIGRDYLGSITHVMDATGTVKQELSYDPWGRFRDPVTQALYDIDHRLTLVLGGRGYTGHEHLLGYGLINMNARLYDPVVGRFLSPDPYVQAPDFSQSFNRYSYCWNNPLRYNDSSGEWFGIDDLAAALIGGFINLGVNIWQGNLHGTPWQMLGQGAAAFGAGAVAGDLALYGPAGWVAGGALIGATNAALSGETGVDILKGAGIGAASSLVGGYAGQFAASSLGAVTVNGFRITSPVIKGAVGGLIGGAGGGYASGFTVGYLTTGDLEQANEMGLSGMKSGAIMGTISGAGAGYRYAKDHDLNLWNGKWNGKISGNADFRTTPNNLEEQLTLKEALTNRGRPIMGGKTNDPNWKGWQKMEYVHRSEGSKQMMVNGQLRWIPSENITTIHYWYNPKTYEVSGFKFK